MTTQDLLSTATPPVMQLVAEPAVASSALWQLRGEIAALHAARPGGPTSASPFVGVLRGGRMRRREGVFDQFATLLQFPTYFGENWDAFADCMRDLEWLRASAIVIVVLDAPDVLADGDADEFGLFLEILRETGEAWSQADEFRGAMPFHVLLHAPPERAPSLEARLAALGLEAPVLRLAPSPA
ncbi:MAG: barstar family protein [Deltaproteobacteria bacterium]|nr:barstar family protein [Deltaproteobacteria bacterium]